LYIWDVSWELSTSGWEKLLLKKGEGEEEEEWKEEGMLERGKEDKGRGGGGGGREEKTVWEDKIKSGLGIKCDDEVW
jgi:hypothetical protein